MEKHDVNQDFNSWEKRHQQLIRKLVTLVDRMRSLTRWAEHNGAALKNDNVTSELELYEMLDKRKVLTEHVFSHSWR